MKPSLQYDKFTDTSPYRFFYMFQFAKIEHPRTIQGLNQNIDKIKQKLSLAAIIFDTVNYALTLNNTQLKEIIEIVKSTRIIYPKKKVLV